MSVCEVKNCVNCGGQGKEIKSYPNGIKKMRCSNCGQLWSALDIKKVAHRRKLQPTQKTPSCPVCGKESGYPGGGICASCYKAGHRKEPQKVRMIFNEEKKCNLRS